MAIEIKHGFVSATADSADTSQIQPSHWNAGHAITAVTKTLLGRPQATDGAVCAHPSRSRRAAGAGLVAPFNPVDAVAALEGVQCQPTGRFCCITFGLNLTAQAGLNRCS